MRLKLTRFPRFLLFVGLAPIWTVAAAPPPRADAFVAAQVARGGLSTGAIYQYRLNCSHEGECELSALRITACGEETDVPNNGRTAYSDVFSTKDGTLEVRQSGEKVLTVKYKDIQDMARVELTLNFVFEKGFTSKPLYNVSNAVKGFSGAALRHGLAGKVTTLELSTPHTKYWTIPMGCAIYFPGDIE